MSDLKDLGRNADQIIWRAWDGDYYADSIHVTHEGAIGISCGGTVHVMPVKDWHKLATLRAALTPPADDEIEAIKERHQVIEVAELLPAPADIQKWYTNVALEAHADRATLLKALDAERQRRVEVKDMLNEVGMLVVQEAYDAGFMDSGEGWNGEYPGDAPTTEYYAEQRMRSIADIWHKRTITKETP